MSRRSETSRCCCNCCSGTMRFSPRLPGPRQSLPIFGLAFLNNRGLFVPEPVALAGLRKRCELRFSSGIVLAVARVTIAARKRQQRHRRAVAGRQDRRCAHVLGLADPHLSRLWPAARFQRSGPQGVQFPGRPEARRPNSSALVLALSLYTASFISLRSCGPASSSVSKGQGEAAAALGLPASARRGVSS